MSKMKKNVVVSIGYQLIAMLYGFVLPRLILAQYGSQVNGLVQSISQFLGIIGLLDMGVGQVVRSALYRPLEEQNRDQISRIMASGGRFYRKIAYGLLGYVMVLVIAYPMLVDHSFGWQFVAGMIVIMAIGSFAQYYFGVIQEQLLHASQKNYLIYSIQILCHVFNMVVCICLVYLDCSIHTVKLATAVIFLIKPLFYTCYIRRNYSIDWKISYAAEPIRQKWHGVAQHLSAVVLDGTDSIVLTFFSTLSNVSIYSVYYMVIGSIQGFYQSAAVGIQSAAGAAWAKQDQKKIRQLFSDAEFGLHTVTVFLFCCTGILIVPFVQVYTRGLTDARYIQPLFAFVLVLAYGIRCLRTPYNIWILAAGHYKQTQGCHITAAVLNLSLSILAVARWGLVGIAAGTLAAMCYQTIWMMLYTTRNLIQCTGTQVLKRWLADLLGVVLICGTTTGIRLEEISYLGWFLLAGKVAAIAMACLALVSRIFYPKEIRRLTGLLTRKIKQK